MTTGDVNHYFRMSDPFNCPKCGAHDFGLNRPKCPHCGYTESNSESNNAAPQPALTGVTGPDDSYPSLVTAVAAPHSPVEKEQRMELKDRGTDEAWDAVVAALTKATGSEDWLRGSASGQQCAVNTIERLAAQSATQASGRDEDWVLAMAYALGLDSGFDVPITPSVPEFQKFFESIRARVSSGSEREQQGG